MTADAEPMGPCTCKVCGKVYLGNPSVQDDLCFEHWMGLATDAYIEVILATRVKPDHLEGAQGWNYYAQPNTIRAMSQADVLDYLAECPRPRSIWRAVGHNSASPNGCGISIPRGFQAYHLSKGWADIGYHWVIDTCGTIYLGRNLVYQGAHASSGGNPGSMGWCMVGNFSGAGGLPSAEQIASARFLCGAHRAAFGYGCSQEWGHRFVSPDTSCPGTNVSLEMLRGWVCGPTPQPEEDEMGKAIMESPGVVTEWDFTTYLNSAKAAVCYLDVINKDVKPIKVTLDLTFDNGDRATKVGAFEIQPRPEVGDPDFAHAEIGGLFGVPNVGNLHVFVTADGLFRAKATEESK